MHTRETLGLVIQAMTLFPRGLGSPRGDYLSFPPSIKTILPSLLPVNSASQKPEAVSYSVLHLSLATDPQTTLLGKGNPQKG